MINQKNPFEVASAQARIYEAGLAEVEGLLRQSIDNACVAGGADLATLDALVDGERQRESQEWLARQQDEIARDKIETLYGRCVRQTLELLPHTNYDARMGGDYFESDDPSQIYNLQRSILWLAVEERLGPIDKRPYYILGSLPVKNKLGYFHAKEYVVHTPNPSSDEDLLYNSDPDVHKITLRNKEPAARLLADRNVNGSVDAAQIATDLRKVFDKKTEAYSLAAWPAIGGTVAPQPPFFVDRSSVERVSYIGYDAADEMRDVPYDPRERFAQCERRIPSEVMKRYDVFGHLAQLTVRFGVQDEYQQILQDLAHDNDTPGELAIRSQD